MKSRTPQECSSNVKSTRISAACREPEIKSLSCRLHLMQWKWSSVNLIWH